MTRLLTSLTDEGQTITHPEHIAEQATSYYKQLFEGTDETNDDVHIEREMQDIMDADYEGMDLSACAVTADTVTQAVMSCPRRKTSAHSAIASLSELGVGDVLVGVVRSRLASKELRHRRSSVARHCSAPASPACSPLARGVWIGGGRGSRRGGGCARRAGECCGGRQCHTLLLALGTLACGRGLGRRSGLTAFDRSGTAYGLRRLGLLRTLTLRVVFCASAQSLLQHLRALC